MIYGYEWADSGSRALRFGTNRIENPVSDSNMPPYISDVVVADFDDLNRNSPTTYECIPAVHYSGGGWFIKDDGIWKLAALTRGVEQHFEDGYEDDPNYILLESWFRQPSNPAHLDADVFDAVQISSYAQWIGDNLPEVPPGDLTGDDAIDAADFAVFASLWRSSRLVSRRRLRAGRRRRCPGSGRLHLPLARPRPLIAACVQSSRRTCNPHVFAVT